MAKKTILLAGAALAASSLQALASAPQPATPTAPATLPIVARASGLTAADLIVGRDGRIAVDVQARAVKVADASNSGSC